MSRSRRETAYKSRSRHYKARHKTASKMTRDGLVERDLVSGEETHISKREQDISLKGKMRTASDAPIMGQARSSAGKKRYYAAYQQSRMARSVSPVGTTDNTIRDTAADDTQRTNHPKHKNRRSAARHRRTTQKPRQYVQHDMRTAAPYDVLRKARHSDSHDTPHTLAEYDKATTHSQRKLERLYGTRKSYDTNLSRKPSDESTPREVNGYFANSKRRRRRGRESKFRFTRGESNSSVKQSRYKRATAYTEERRQTEQSNGVSSYILLPYTPTPYSPASRQNEQAITQQTDVVQTVVAQQPQLHDSNTSDLPPVRYEPAAPPKLTVKQQGREYIKRAMYAEVYRRYADEKSGKKPSADTHTQTDGNSTSHEHKRTKRQTSSATDSSKPKRKSKLQFEQGEKAKASEPTRSDGKSKSGKAKTKSSDKTSDVPPDKTPDVSPNKAKRGIGHKVISSTLSKTDKPVADESRDEGTENITVEAAHNTARAAKFTYDTTRRTYEVGKGTARIAHDTGRLTYNVVRAAASKLRFSKETPQSSNTSQNNKSSSKKAQRQNIKRSYARNHAAPNKTVDTLKDRAIEAVKGIVQNISKAAFGFAKKYIIALLLTLLGFLILFLLIFGFIGIIAASFGSAALPTLYLASDEKVDDAEVFYSQWEAELISQIATIRTAYPDYDDYRFNIDNIGHNPYELMAYLTVMYSDFESVDFYTVLRELFDTQYTLTIADYTETPSDGSQKKILTVTLTSQSLTDIILPQLDEQQLTHYYLLMQSKGFRQYVKSPFEFDWLSRVTMRYGYNVDAAGNITRSDGVVIAVSPGTPIKAGISGSVVAVGADYIIIGDSELNVRYAQCQTTTKPLGAEVNVGDVIGTSTSSLYIEIIKGGRRLNPLYFAETNNTYDPNNPFVPPEYGTPGLPLGDGSYAALIAEAEKYIGMSYVFGGSTPQTSFDCSGYVCWVYTKSGVYNLPRTTAQGIFNQCTVVRPEQARPGDLIFFHSTYSTSDTVTHIGIYVGGGMMLHCGNPIGYTSINTSYWQSKFFAYGRLP